MSTDDPFISEPFDVTPGAGEVVTSGQPARPRRAGRRTVVVVATAIVVAGGGGAIALAAGGSSNHGNQPGAGPDGAAPSSGEGPAGGFAGHAGGGFHGFGGFGGIGGTAGAFGALHGTFVVPKTSGSGSTATTTYVTEEIQTGTVTALSATSISLKSSDGFTATYVLGSSTKKASGLKTGSTATVLATGAPETATFVGTGARAGGFAGGGRPGDTRPSGAPSGFPTSRPSGFPTGAPSGFPGGAAIA